MILTVEQRDSLLNKLSTEQREYLSNQLVRGRRTAFANALARAKGHHIPENTDPEDIETLLSDWIYTGYVDAGHVTPDLKCECGRSLRYQHQVENKTTGEKKKFGIEHLKEHLGIDASIVAAVRKGFDAIDYELDEILIKSQNNWQLDPELKAYTNGLSADIEAHIKLNIPLLERQIRRIRQSMQQPSPRRSTMAIQVVQPVVPKELDLFSWTESPADMNTASTTQPIGLELADVWKKPVSDYLHKGIRSARIICDLLIQEHGAPDDRFLTEKPKIYLLVCWYIEATYPSVRITRNGTDDRLYELVQ